MNNLPENRFVDYKLKGGILFVKFLPGETLDLVAAKRIVRDRIIRQNGFYFPILCDIRQVPEFDKDAKDYFVKEGSHLIKALAFLVNPNMNYIKYRYFILFISGKFPTQAHTDLEGALDFLKPYSEPGIDGLPESNDTE